MKRLFFPLFVVFLLLAFCFSTNSSYAATGWEKMKQRAISKPKAEKKTEDKKAEKTGDSPADARPMTRAERIEFNKEKKRKEIEDRRKNMPPIKMVFVEGGCFDMGDFTNSGDDDERPVHKVCLSDYYIGETEVNNGLWQSVMGFPYKEKLDPKLPLTNISWAWATTFIEKLNELVDGFYRLPTEAEWEYAARERGKNIRWSGTDRDEDIQDFAWFAYNSEGKLHYSKQKKPNALGIYDMTGNAAEWVEDNFDFEYYKNSPEEDPYGPEFSSWRTIRGGSIFDESQKLRTTYRHAKEGTLLSPVIGFRLAE